MGGEFWISEVTTLKADNIEWKITHFLWTVEDRTLSYDPKIRLDFVQMCYDLCLLCSMIKVEHGIYVCSVLKGKPGDKLVKKKKRNKRQ